MTRVLAFLATVIFTVVLSLAGDQSPRNEAEKSDSADVEPAVVRQNLPDNLSSGTTAGEAVARLEKKAAETKEDAKDVERLCETGVISKVEMEERLLKVVQCEAELASARLAEAKQKIADLQSKAASVESATDQLASAKATLKQLSEAMEAAKAKRERAELETAEANVRRQQQLLKLGLAAQSDVDGAKEKLAELKAQKN
jgi:multidrug resistance efflux pump